MMRSLVVVALVRSALASAPDVASGQTETERQLAAAREASGDAHVRARPTPSTDVRRPGRDGRRRLELMENDGRDQPKPEGDVVLTGDPHPFVVGEDVTIGFLEMVRSCAAASLAGLD